MSNYRWLILGLAFLSIGVTDAIWISFSLFLVALTGHFGWSFGPTAAIFSWMLVAGACATPVIGALIDRFGARRVCPASALLLALGLALAGIANSLWQFYGIYALLIGSGMSGLSTAANFTVLQQWFSAGRGAVLGLADAGGGLGILVIVPLLQAIIATHGYRTAYLALAAIVLALGPLHLVLQRRPRIHIAPGGAASATLDLAPSRAAQPPWTVRRARRTPTFWLLLGGLFLLSGATAMLSVHQIAAMVESGFSESQAAAAVGLAGIANAAGKLSLGALSDHLGRVWAFSLSVCSIVLAIACLLLASVWPQAWLAYAFALLLGAGIGVGMPLFAALVGDVFGSASFGAIFGLIGIGAGAGGALGPVLGGYLFDAVHSYRAAFVATIVVAVGACVCFWAAAWAGRRMQWSV